MHLVALGVMRKLILFWIYKGPLNCRISGRKINELTASILNIKNCIPSDFPRKPREIQEVRRWKASELRLFLVYIGPIVLKNIISSDCYYNFIALNIAMIILLSPDLQHMVNYAQKLLEYFVNTFDKIYGSHSVSHNIHGLLHICDDYYNFGHLDNCSCFPFENFMKELKSMVRKHEKPLQQVVHRIQEKNETYLDNLDKFIEHYNLKKPHNDGPLLDGLEGPQFSKIVFNNFTINTLNNRENVILTISGQIVKCVNIAHHNNKAIFVGQEFLQKYPVYNSPICSTKLDIYHVNNLSDTNSFWDINEIKKKMIIINFKNQLIVIPIKHSSL